MSAMKESLPAATTCEYSYMYIEADQPDITKIVEYLPYLDKEDYRYVKLKLFTVSNMLPVGHGKMSGNGIVAVIDAKLQHKLKFQTIYNGKFLRPESEQNLAIRHSYAVEYNDEQYTALLAYGTDGGYLIIQKAHKLYNVEELVVHKPVEDA